MNSYITLAKLAVENYLKERKIIEPPPGLPKEFWGRKAGVFVTIEKNGGLRGCIGTYSATRKNIAEEIIHNAIAAATEDNRFNPVSESELPELSYTVYVLNPPEPVDDMRRLDPEKYGIIVKSQGFIAGSDPIFNPAPKPYQKTGLLLPGLKGINTAEQQILIACQKGGIDPEREKILIYRFAVKKFTQ